MSDSKNDFNDLHLVAGLDAVNDQIALAKMSESAHTRQLLVGEIPEFEQAPDELFTPPEAALNDWEENLQRSKEGAIKSMVSNIVLILSNDPVFKDGLAYCDLSYRMLKRRELLPHMTEGEWTDADTAHVVNWLGLKYRFNPSRQLMTDALLVVSQHHRFHPVREYLNGLTWDGVPRIDAWLKDVFGAVAKNENTDDGIEYLKSAGRYFLIGAVARVMSAPVKMDNVLILEGSQGAGKSTAVGILFGDWFSDSPIPIGDKDAFQIIQGTWGCELAELDSFNKAESTGAKLFFSSSSDRYRPSYGQFAQTFHRQCVFVGTTNQDEYLKDYTGNRRYWPVYCNKVDAQALRDMRNQLWAEALHFYNEGRDAKQREESQRWWPDEAMKELFEAEQDARLQLDPWQIKIEDHLYKIKYEHVTSNEIISIALNKDIAAVTRADQNRLSPIMHSLGWKNTRKRVDVEGSPKKVLRHVYVPPRDWKAGEISEPFGGDE